MTADELAHLFNTEFGLHDQWPRSYKVDGDTYANVCQRIFEYAIKTGPYREITIFIGPNNGIIFKNVELILTHERPKLDN